MSTMKKADDRIMLIIKRFEDIGFSAKSNHFWYSQNSESGVLWLLTFTLLPDCIGLDIL
jgi:hypothetical protein